MVLKKVIRVESLVILFLIFLISGISPFFQNNNQYLLLTGFLAVVFYLRKEYIDNIIIYISIVWIFINFISIKLINVGQPYSVITIFTRLFPLYVVYVIVKIGGKSFFKNLCDIIFYLTIISFPFFLIQITSPGLITKLGSVFGPITNPEFAAHGNWTSYVWTYCVWHPFRNSGFMWEPGAFAGFLILGITYRFSVNQFKIDKYIIVFLIGLITSLSTAGFLAFGLILIALLVVYQKKSVFLIFLIPAFVYGSVEFYNRSEFLYAKIDRYLSLGTNVWGDQQEDFSYKTNRLGYAIMVLDEAIHWPLGNGVIIHSTYKLNKYGKIRGPGSLSDILHQWGWIGLIICIVSIYKLYRRRTNGIISFIFTIALLIMFFSNPWDYLLLMYALIYFVNVTEAREDSKYIENKNKVKNLLV